MTTKLQTFGPIIISLVTALAILATAFFAKDSDYENSWLYILAIGSLITAAFEVYSKRTEKCKR